jgi:hypothetical protein
MGTSVSVSLMTDDGDDYDDGAFINVLRVEEEVGARFKNKLMGGFSLIYK